MNEKIFTGWKEISQELGGYHPDYLRRLFRDVRGSIELKYWFGKKRRIKMTQEETVTFKRMVSR